MTRYSYRSGDTKDRLAFLIGLVFAAAVGAGLWLGVVLVFSLGVP